MADFGDVMSGMAQAMRRIDKDTVRLGVDLEDASGISVTTSVPTSATPTQSTASISTTSATILEASATRLGASIYNESGAACYVKLGATASATSYTVLLAIDGYYELPYGYVGVVDGITASGTAVLRVTSFAA
jgi:hypothetical protein